MTFKKTLTIILLFFAISCVKNEAPNSIVNGTKPDCNTLKVRKVIYNPELVNKRPTIHVTIENTCKTCVDNWVYLGLFMIDKTTNDTVARTCSNCLSGIKNREKGTYELATELTGLPNLKNITFSYDYLCMDVPYQPR